MKTTTIKEVSRELKARDRIALRKGTGILSLKKALDEQKEIHIMPSFYAVLETTDDESGESATSLVFEDAKTFKKYRTGSSVFIQSFLSIAEEMRKDKEENYEICCLKKKSTKGGNLYLDCEIR